MWSPGPGSIIPSMSYLIELNSFLLVLVLIFNLFLGLFILFYNQRSQTFRFFAYFLFSIAFWTLTFLIFQNTSRPEWLLFTRRLTPIGSALIAGFFLLFSLGLVEPEKKMPRQTIAYIFILPVFFVLASFFSGWLVRSIVVPADGPLFLGKALFGPLYPLFALFFVGYFLASVYFLFRRYIQTEGREKLQMFYILIGVVSSGAAGIVLSLVLPLAGFGRFFITGPFFTIFLVSFVAYAIIRYRLLEITDLVLRGIIFLFGVSVAVGTIFLLAAGSLGLLIPFYIMTATLTLGVLVWSRGPRQVLNFVFLLSTIFLTVWFYGILAYWSSSSAAEAYSWALFINGTMAFMPAIFLHFAYLFPYQTRPIGWGSLLAWYLTALIFAALVFGQATIAGVVLTRHGYEMVTTPFYLAYNAYFLFFFARGFLVLTEKSRRSVGTRKMQVRYLFLGAFLGFAIPFVTNLALPVFGITALTKYGPYSTLFFIAFSAYAIVRHRLMSVEVVIRYSTVYAAASLIILAFWTLAVILLERFVQGFLGYSSLIVTGLSALMIAFLFQPLVRLFQALVDHLFFRDRYDYQKTLRDISHQIASVIKLEELTRLIVSSFIDIMKVAEISFLIREKEGEHFRSVSLPLSRYKKIEIDKHSPIVSWLSAAKDILVREEIDDELNRQEPADKKGLAEVRDEMERLGISLWVPIITKDELVGIIALGNKLSGDVYSSEDLGLLSTLASQTAVALENARLYDEVVSMKDYNQEILQSMVSGVLTADVKGRIVTYNSMAERISGRRAEDVLGKSAEEIWGKNSSLSGIIEDSLRDRCFINHEAGIVVPDKGLVPVSFSSTLLRDSLGKKMGVLVTILDLSEVKELEEKVRRADKLGALATMAAGMAHEIKNPLSSMKVLSQLLPLKFDDPDFRQKLQEIFPREINRIDRIVESLLGFARATALTFEKSDLNSLIDETAKYFVDQARSAEVKINADYGDLPPVEVDRGQISQVFSNLVLNAIQAMPQGGELKISSRPGRSIEGVVREVKIVVADNGHGIPEDQLKKLFDPFFTTKYAGTGLGLTITHNIVDGHRGFIDVESQVGKGTTFTVTLPVSQGLI